ncbi:hypothetical protein Q7P37_009959 [Cladosporium fusiforme]
MASAGSDFDSIFRHKQRYNITICKPCDFAIVPEQIDRHLREHHPRVGKEKRWRIAAIGVALEEVAHSKEEVIYPQANEGPIGGLAVYKDGLLSQEESIGEDGEEDEAEDETIDGESQLREVLREIRAKVADARQRQAVDGSFKRYVADPWLEFIGWHRRLQGFQ